MLKGIKIKNYRGIREGQVDDFGAVNLFLGPNGSGKSTLLESIFLGASRRPNSEFRSQMHGSGPLIQLRHNENGFPSPEMYNQKDTSKPIEVVYYFEDGSSTLKFQGFEFSPKLSEPKVSYFERLKLLDVRVLLDKTMELNSWDQVLNTRTDRELIKAINEVFGLKIESLSYSASSQVLKALFSDRDYALNIDDLAAGMRIAFRLFLGILLTKDSAVLAEEFDGYQHVESLPRFVRALFQLSTKMHSQLFLATHSLETVRVFVQEAAKSTSKVDLEVFQTTLQLDGTFQASRLTALEAQTLLSGGFDIRRTA
jgi:AAA15 family ATPase/GTPase